MRRVLYIFLFGAACTSTVSSYPLATFFGGKSAKGLVTGGVLHASDGNSGTICLRRANVTCRGNYTAPSDGRSKNVGLACDDGSHAQLTLNWTKLGKTLVFQTSHLTFEGEGQSRVSFPVSEKNKWSDPCAVY